MSKGPIEGPIDRFFGMCLTFGAAVAVLNWAVIRLEPVMPYLFLGAVIYGFFRWQRR